MTDQPPPTDKKPRRRSAPRKRAPAKRTRKTPEVPQVVANAPGATADADRAASSPEAMAARLDPAPLVDAGDRGDAPATDSPLAAQAASETATAPITPAVAETSTPERRAPRTKPDDSTTPAAVGPTSLPPTTAAAFPKQAELRPGELIRVPLSIRWRDLDAFNHVNNSKYLSYLEEARLRWMLAMPGMGMDEDVAPVVAASNLNYRRPIEWPGDVVVELFVERIGGSSLTIGHRIVDSKDGGTLYCDGNVVMVWIDRNSGRSAPLPDSVRAACR